MKCPKCQAENRAGAKFCEDCGASLAIPCRACGAELTPGKKFCGSCGAPTSADKPVARSDKPIERPDRPAEPTEKPAERPIEVADRFASPQSFTAMSERLEPEEVHAIMDRAFEVILGVFYHMKRTTQKFTLFRFTTLFGAP